MSKMTYVCLYLDYRNQLAPLSDGARGKLVMAMLNYAATGQVPELTGPAKYVWPAFQGQIDRDFSRYQEMCRTNRRNGSKGGRPPKNREPFPKTEGLLEKPEKPKEKEKDRKKEMENGREKNTDVSCSPLPFSPPSLEEVTDYCMQQGLAMDAAKFVDHYTSNGWRVGTNPMQD